jgi:hypothetical protein
MEKIYEKFGGRFLYKGKVYNPNTYDPTYNFIDKCTGKKISIINSAVWRTQKEEIEIIEKALSDIISKERDIKIDYIISKK